MNITIWNEFVHEQRFEEIKAIYPEGIHKKIGSLFEEQHSVKYATLEMPNHGLTKELLENTDVLFWWGHMAHEQVDDTIVELVHEQVLRGMGLVVLHSGHASKIFKRVLGTNTGALKWREAGEKEIVWNINPTHEITRGIGDHFIIEQEEMYGEHFNIPEPDQNIFISSFEGGEVFRSGACWYRGYGKVFYFRPGHEAYPTYYDKNVQKVLINAVHWAKRRNNDQIVYGNTKPIFDFKENINTVNLHDIIK